MKQVHIYTNGKSHFTLEGYDKMAGVSHENGITYAKSVSHITAMSLHGNGSLHYVEGIGDRKCLSGISLKRGMELGNFNVL